MTSSSNFGASDTTAFSSFTMSVSRLTALPSRLLKDLNRDSTRELKPKFAVPVDTHDRRAL